MRPTTPAVTLVALLLIPILAAGATVTTTDTTRHVTRSVASPTPLPDPFSAFDILGDQAAWRVDVDPVAVVRIDATADDLAPFHLRAAPWGERATASPVPGARQSFTLDGEVARVWRVEVDPALGVDVDVKVRFHGHLVDTDGRAWPFTLTDLPRATCPQGSCLP